MWIKRSSKVIKMRYFLHLPSTSDVLLQKKKEKPIPCINTRAFCINAQTLFVWNVHKCYPPFPLFIELRVPSIFPLQKGIHKKYDLLFTPLSTPLKKRKIREIYTQLLSLHKFIPKKWRVIFLFPFYPSKKKQKHSFLFLTPFSLLHAKLVRGEERDKLKKKGEKRVGISFSFGIFVFVNVHM